MKLTGVLVLAGLMTAVIASISSSPHSPPVAVIPTLGAPDSSMRTAALDRCRAVSTPDMDCGAAWDAEHRRFFGRAAR